MARRQRRAGDMPRPDGGLARRFCFAAPVMWALFATSVSGQVRPFPSAPPPPRLDIPAGVEVEGPSDELLQTVTRYGEPVVGRSYVRAGSLRLVLLPDGQIVRRDGATLARGKAKFEPLTGKEMAARLKSRAPHMQVQPYREYVFVSNTSPLFTQVTRRILTTMSPAIRKYMRAQGIKIHAPEVPLVVLMFRTREEFDRYQRMPPEVLAYYNPWTNYIVLHETSRYNRLPREQAIRETIATIAHEGVHQILHNIGVQQRLSQWPMWLSEGLAEYFAPTELGRRMDWKGAGEVNDLRMLELEHYVKAKAFDTWPGEMIEHTVGAARLTSTGYATAWALTHYLATKRKKTFDDLLRELSGLGPLQKVGEPNASGLVPENMELFKKHFSSDLARIERDLIAHLEKLPYTDPFAAAPHHVALITLRRGKENGWKANIFHTSDQAERWAAHYIETLDSNIQPEVRVIRVKNRAAAEQLIKQFAATQRK